MKTDNRVDDKGRVLCRAVSASGVGVALLVIGIAFGVSGCKLENNMNYPHDMGGGCIAGMNSGGSEFGAIGVGQIQGSTTYSLVAQSFRAPTNADVNVVSLDLRAHTQNGLPLSGELLLQIESNSEATNTPDGYPLATASLLLNPANNGGGVNTSYAKFYAFNFPASVSLTAGRTYWLVLQKSYQDDAMNYVEWLGNPQSGYTDGTALYLDERNNPQWSDAQIGPNRDLLFMVNCS